MGQASVSSSGVNDCEIMYSTGVITTIASAISAAYKATVPSDGRRRRRRTRRLEAEAATVSLLQLVSRAQQPELEQRNGNHDHRQRNGHRRGVAHPAECPGGLVQIDHHRSGLVAGSTSGHHERLSEYLHFGNDL